VDLGSYVPEDRRWALATGYALPARTTGSALIADIAGFTAFTEVLRVTLGARRGADEVTRHLDAVYTALITKVQEQRGAVVSFAGDAITCWFDDREGAASARAVSCAVAMQRAIRSLDAIEMPKRVGVAIGLKVAVASGEAMRFLVGDPTSQVFDVLSGSAVRRAAAAEKLARPGSVLLDGQTVRALGDAVAVEDWYEHRATGNGFAVLGQLHVEMPTAAHVHAAVVDETLLHPWLHPAVLQRERTAPTLSTEYRPCIALFIGFSTIDDEAPEHVVAFMKTLQAAAQRHEGMPLALTVEETGGYAHVNFGAITAHEDDARRALRLAVELRAVESRSCGITALRIGIAQGPMRIGSFGAPMRRAFGAMGDDVNLAARLMQSAAPGEIVISAQVQRGTAEFFSTEARAPVTMKGKGEPLPVFAVVDERPRRAMRLQEPAYALPMVGREAELKAGVEALDASLSGRAQLIGIVGEAGIGKSRLVAEVVRAARRRGFTGYGGTCRSHSVATPYQPWKAIWSAFFNLDAEWPLRRQVAVLRAELEERTPQRVDALPLLGQLLDLDVPDNAFTRALEPRLRQSALHALLEDALKSAASEGPVLIAIEDLHWIDPASLDLLEQLVRAVGRLPVCFVIAFRATPGELDSHRLMGLAAFRRIDLAELTRAQCEQAIRAKLVQLYPARGGGVPGELVDRLSTRAQGNPFFLEELLNYLHDRGLDPHDSADLARIELPDSLHTLVLSRIDQLGQREQLTLRAASIIGRSFRARWLAGYCPEVGAPSQLKAALDTLDSLDITPLESVEPELCYLFKHIITHEVTYESLPFAARARLHERLARYLESAYADAPPAELLSFHYGRSENHGKRREHLRKAGEAAQRAFANDTAIAHYGELLPLLDDPAQQAAIRLQRGAVLELTGRYDDADGDDRAALELALTTGDATLAARAQLALGRLHRLRGEFDAALEWLGKARAALSTEGGEIALETGLVHFRMGDYPRARLGFDEGLAAARLAGDRTNSATALNYLGMVAESQGDNVTAQELHRQALDARREIGDTWGISWSLNNLGNVAIDLGRHAEARALFEESLELKRAMGDKAGVGSVLNNLGLVALVQGNLASARTLFEQALALMREVGDRFVIASLLGNLAKVLSDQGDIDAARPVYDESLALSREMGDKWGVAASLCSFGLASLAADDTTTAQNCLDECLELCRALDEPSLTASALLGLALLRLDESDACAVVQARPLVTESLSLRQAMAEPLPLTSSLIGAAMLELRLGDASGAAKLLGAVDAALAAIEAPVEAEMQAFHRRARAEALEALGEDSFESAWQSGAHWSLEHAADVALRAISTWVTARAQ
jgi:class 3 adenylate cyclase/tetratricopeptide (TPR) repeat protein